MGEAHTPELGDYGNRSFDECAALIKAAPRLLAALKAIENESVFNQQRFAEDTDTDYFLRCFRAVKERARAAIALAEGRTDQREGG